MSHDAPAPVVRPLKERLKGASKGVVALALLGGWLLLMRREGWVATTGGGVFSLGFLLVAGTVGGQCAAIFGFPRLTGYLAVGVLSGPHVLELFTADDVRSLTLVNTLALALIALQAGAELTIPMLRRSFKSLSWATLMQTIIIAPGMALLFFALSPFLDFTEGLSTAALLAVGLVWGAMAVSKAATDTLAILTETRAKGPVPEHALGVVILIDVVVLVLFAFALMLARSTIDPSGSLSLAVFEALGLELVASVAAGTTFGLLIAFYFWAIGRERLLFTVVAAYGIAAFCAYFHYDTLLVFVVAGFVVMNLTREGHHLVETTESASTAVMVVFFATAGARLDVGAMAIYGPIALALALGRVGLTVLSAQIGHRLAKDPPVVRRYAWTSFISQAGVTIGLGTIAAESLGEVGAGVSTLLIAVIGINEMVGPVAFKLGLAKAAEYAATHPSPAAEEPGEKEEAAPEESLLRALRADLERAAERFEHDVEPTDTGLRVLLLLESDGAPVEGSLTITVKEGQAAAELSSRLPSSSQPPFRLRPKSGVRGLVERLGGGRTLSGILMLEMKSGDDALDDAFTAEGAEAARPLIRKLAPALLDAHAPLTVEVSATRFVMRCPRLPDEGSVRQDTLERLFTVWSQVNADANQRKPTRKKAPEPM